MAIVDTIPTLVQTRQPIERPPQSQTMWSLIPRAFVHFRLEGATLDAKPVNDDQHLRISGVLAAGFAYQFIQIGCTIAQDVAKSWGSRPIMRIVNWTPGAAAGLHLPFFFEDADEFADASAATEVVVLRAPAMDWSAGKQIIFNPQGGAISFSFLATNESDPAGAAGTIDFLASFFEFDLTQAMRFGLQTPAPTLAR